MIKATKAQTRILWALALMALPTIMSAQSYYDDDIYYNPSKEQTKPAKNSKKNTSTSYDFPTEYPAADTYTVNTGSTRNVDEYNRRGQFLVSDSVAPSEIVGGELGNEDTYSNTRRIQRFHNGGIVESMSDDDYATYVVTDPAQINVYVESPYYSPLYSYYSPFYSPYSSWTFGSPYWSLSWGFYDPWAWCWSPAFSWGPSWGWGPSWAWGPSWGPGWGHGWGPGWGHGPSWGPGPGGPGGNHWVTNTPSGSSRPHNVPAGNTGTRRPGSSVRPVATGTSSNRVGTSTGRTGNSGFGYQGRGQGSTTTASPARPNNSNTGVSTQPTRGRNNGSGTTTRSTNTQQRNTYTPQRSTNRSTGSSYGGGSRGGGYGGGYGGGGGSRTGGGGRGRGR